MSKSRLIEVNKYNMPLFMEKDEEEKVFDAFPSQPDKGRKEKPRRKDGVLYTANKYNMKLFEPNIYSGVEPGSSKMEIGSGTSLNLGRSSVSQNDLTFGQNSPMSNMLGNLSSGIKSNTSGGIGGVQTSGLANTSLIDSNKFGGSNYNFDASNGLSGSALKGLNDANVQQAAFSAFKMGQEGGAGGEGAGAMGGLAQAGIGAAAGIGAQIGKSEKNKRGLFDVLDPVHQLAGGRESKVGNAMGDAGTSLFMAGASTGQPYLMLAGAAVKILGGLTNAGFGTAIDTKRLAGVNAGIDANKAYTSNATSLDSIKGPEAVLTNAKGIYRGGWFTSGAEKNDALRERMIAARSWADRSMVNNMNNLIGDQLNNALASYSAFGGPITRRKRKKI